jgi:predicted transglutaminase-like cysteine proteinase
MCRGSSRVSFGVSLQHRSYSLAHALVHLPRSAARVAATRASTVARVLVVCLAAWGAIAVALLILQRPVVLGTGGLVSVVPPGLAMFCMHSPRECQVAPLASLGANAIPVLRFLNSDVNAGIVYRAPERTEQHGLNYWQVLRNGQQGACIDYVLAKRHRLIALGYPAGAFSIAILHVAGQPSDQLHAVLLARVAGQILVLDSLGDEVQRVERVSGYDWLSYSGFGNLLDWRAGAPLAARIAAESAR